MLLISFFSGKDFDSNVKEEEEANDSGSDFDFGEKVVDDTPPLSSNGKGKKREELAPSSAKGKKAKHVEEDEDKVIETNKKGKKRKLEVNVVHFLRIELVGSL
jgi:hypothetical protein